jgi:hypothetical protein
MWLMSRRASFLTAAAAVLTMAAPAGAAGDRAIVFSFTPTERAQIAIWIEGADGRFLGTVGLTQAVGARGIGNRPGAAQMNSGYRWPYGRREGVLPIWAHRRMSAPGAVPFPRIVFQDRVEGLASRTCDDSTRDAYFCLSFNVASTGRDQLDAITCASASAFNSDKGRILTADDVAAGYSEPIRLGGQEVTRPLGLGSPYPPRRDFITCASASHVSSCVGGPNGTCQDHADAATYADVARAVMPDIDAVTMATPPAGVEQAVMYSVPAEWPDGDYVAYLEVNTEGDYNGTFNADTFPTPCAPFDNCMVPYWDSWAVEYGYAYRGQPSVVFAVPFTIGAAATFSTVRPVGFGSVDGTDGDPGAMHDMNGTITDDPTGAPGSGADRLLMNASFSSRLEVEVRPCISQTAPGAPTELVVEPVADPKHSHEWAHLRFRAPADAVAGISRYEVRTSSDQAIIAGDATSFIRGLPGQAASSKTEGLVVPVDGAPGSVVEADLGGLRTMTHYWIGVRAVDRCNRAGPHAVAEITTTAVNFTRLSGCFIATAAWGSPLEPTVAALRQARDRLAGESSLFAVATELYYRSSPPAADVLRRSETARALARHLLGPVGAAAQSVASSR